MTFDDNNYPALMVSPDIETDLTEETITADDESKMRSAILQAHKTQVQRNGVAPTTIAITGGWWLKLHDFLTSLRLSFNKFAPQSGGRWYSPMFSLGYMDRTEGEPKPEGESMADEQEPVTEIMRRVQEKMEEETGQDSEPVQVIEPVKRIVDADEQPPTVMELVNKIATGTGGQTTVSEVESMLELTIFSVDNEEVDVDFPLGSNGAIVMQKEDTILHVWPMFDETSETDDDDKVGVMFTDQPRSVYIFTANLVSVYDYTLGEFAGLFGEYIEEELAHEGDREVVSYEQFVELMQDVYKVDVTAT